MQSWSGDDMEGTVQALPEAGLDKSAEFRVFLGPKDVTYVIARTPTSGALFASDGTEFRKLSPPVFAETYGGTVDKDGKLWIVNRDGKGAAYRLDGEAWSPVKLPDEATLRKALDDVENPQPLFLKPSSIVMHEGALYIGTTVIEGTDRPVGGALVTIPKEAL